MALRLFNQINSKLFRSYKTQALAPSKATKLQEKNPNDTAIVQETAENVDLVSEDGQAIQKEDNQIKFTTKSNQYWLDDIKASLMSMMKPNQPYKSPMSCQTRFFSAPGSDQCKVTKTGTAAQCKKFKLCNCEQPDKTICKITIQPAKCKKKEAPYPSFSETCYEEPYNKPSECKLCPWKSEDNPSFKGPIITSRKLHTGRPWMSSNTVSSDGGREGAEELPSGKSDKVWKLVGVAEQSATLSPVPENATIGDKLNIINMTSPRRLSLLSESEEASGGRPCTKFPFKVFKYEIGSKKTEKESCDRKPCVKKKRKLIKDCPPSKDKVCSQLAYDEVFKGDFFNESVMRIVMQKKDGECDTNQHQTCEIPEDCKRKECPKKTGRTLSCPSESLIRPAGYKRKPKKNKKKTSRVDEESEEINELPLVPHPVYNGGVIYNNTYLR